MGGLAAGPLDPALVRLRAGRRVLGAGFLIAPDVIATCAHVLDDDLVADFPFLSSHDHAVEVLERDDELDIAILRLTDPPPGALPVPARISGEVRDHRFRTFGFPRDMPDGIWATGRLIGAQGAGRIQMAVDPDHWHVEPGFSGAPVWDEELAGVVGMVVTVAARSGTTAHLVPTTALGAAWTTPARNPYRGLRSFREEDTELFHGRDADTDRLFDLVQRQDVVAVAGPSGSGKSSLVRAGLVPKLKRHGATVVYLGPGDEVPGSPEPGTVLVLDQFEETVMADPAAAREKLAAVIRLAGTARTVLTLRSRSLDELITRDTVDELGRAVWFLEPMSREQLAAAVEGPAAEVGGLAFESGLVQRILDDAEPGTLPLLSLVLDQLWQHRHGGWLTHDAYEKLGRIPGAISTAADGVLTSLSPGQRATARKLLTRLTRPDGEGGYSRRSADLADLDAEIASVLAAERLITIQDERVDLAHQALIDHWPTLRNWLTEDAEFLGWRAKLDDLRNSGGQLTGAPLVEAIDWLRARPDDIPAGPRDFVRRSQAEQRRSQRRWRAITAVSVVLALISAGLTVSVYAQNNELDGRLRTNNAINLAQQAGRAATGDPAQALQLALAAWREDPGNSDAFGALLQQRLHWRGTDRILTGPTGLQDEPMASQDGRVVLTRSELPTGPVTVWWNLHEPAPKSRVIPESSDSLFALSPDGRTLAVPGEETGLRLWDLTAPGGPISLDPRGAFGEVAFSANSRYLAVLPPAGTSGVVQLWDVHDRRELPSRIVVSNEQSNRVRSFYPANDGRALVTVQKRSEQGYAPAVLDFADGTELRAFPVDPDSDTDVLGNGTHMYSCRGNTVTVNDLFSAAPPVQFEVPVCSPFLSKAGEHLIAEAGHGYEVTRWRTGEQRSASAIDLPRAWNFSSPVLVGEPDGNLTSIVVSDGVVQVTAMPTSTVVTGAEALSYVPDEHSPDGRYWISYASALDPSGDYDLELRNGFGEVLAHRRTEGPPTVAFHPSGERLAVVTGATMRIYRTQGLVVEHEVTLPLPAGADGNEGADLITGPNGEFLAVINGILSSWDPRTGAQTAPPLDLSGPQDSFAANGGPMITPRPGKPEQVLVSRRDSLALWDVRTRRVIVESPSLGLLQTASRPVVSSDGTTAAAMDEAKTSIVIFNLETDQVHARLNGSFDKLHGISGDYLYTNGKDEPINVWQWRERRLVARIPNDSRNTSPALDGDQLIPNETPGQLRGIPLDPDAWFRDLCRISDREFTPAELALLPEGVSTEPPCEAS